MGIRLRTGKTMELCSSLAKSNRDDNVKMLLNGGVALQRAMNSALVGRGCSTSQAWPSSTWNFRTWGGSGIAVEALQFWRDLDSKAVETEKIYRIPAPLATSVNPAIADELLARVEPHLVGVLFICHWESGLQPCMHARYIDGISTVRGEEEILLVGYSGVQLISIDDQSQPVKIEIKILQDNRSIPEYVPLALWH